MDMIDIQQYKLGINCNVLTIMQDIVNVQEYKFKHSSGVYNCELLDYYYNLYKESLFF